MSLNLQCSLESKNHGEWKLRSEEVRCFGFGQTFKVLQYSLSMVTMLIVTIHLPLLSNFVWFRYIWTIDETNFLAQNDQCTCLQWPLSSMLTIGWQSRELVKILTQVLRKRRNLRPMMLLLPQFSSPWLLTVLSLMTATNARRRRDKRMMSLYQPSQRWASCFCSNERSLSPRLWTFHVAQEDGGRSSPLSSKFTHSVNNHKMLWAKVIRQSVFQVIKSLCLGNFRKAPSLL